MVQGIGCEMRTRLPGGKLQAMTHCYCYDMWVPRARLFEAVVLIAQRDQYGEWDALVWPDGRPLNEGADVASLTPFRFEITRELAFEFAEDEELREFNEYQARRARDQNAWMRESARPRPQMSGWLSHLKQCLLKAEPETQNVAVPPPNLESLMLPEQNFRTADGSYLVGAFETTIGGIDEGHEWLDGEEDLVRIRFAGGASDVSYLMQDSPSVKRWFLELARDIGAYAWVFSREGPGLLLYLGGEEFEISYDDESCDDDVCGSPFGLAALAGRPCSENARRSNDLGLWTWERDLTEPQKEALMRATRDEDSGIRAKALKAFSQWHRPQEKAVIEAALDDADARVRELAVYLYAREEGSDIAPVLRLIETDASASVRAQAIRALGNFPASLPVVRELLLQTPTPDNANSIAAALDALDRLLYLPQSADVIREALARPDFSQPARARAQLVECAEIEARRRENAADAGR